MCEYEILGIHFSSGVWHLTVQCSLLSLNLTCGLCCPAFQKLAL